MEQMICLGKPCLNSWSIKLWDWMVVALREQKKKKDCLIKLAHFKFWWYSQITLSQDCINLCSGVNYGWEWSSWMERRKITSISYYEILYFSKIFSIFKYRIYTYILKPWVLRTHSLEKNIFSLFKIFNDFVWFSFKIILTVKFLCLWIHFSFHIYFIVL